MTDDDSRHQANISISRKDWAAFGKAAGDRERSRLIREFVLWYSGVPGARAPRRPLDDCAP